MLVSQGCCAGESGLFCSCVNAVVLVNQVCSVCASLCLILSVNLSLCASVCHSL